MNPRTHRRVTSDTFVRGGLRDILAVALATVAISLVAALIALAVALVY